MIYKQGKKHKENDNIALIKIIQFKDNKLKFKSKCQ